MTQTYVPGLQATPFPQVIPHLPSGSGRWVPDPLGGRVGQDSFTGAKGYPLCSPRPRVSGYMGPPLQRRRLLDPYHYRRGEPQILGLGKGVYIRNYINVYA